MDALKLEQRAVDEVQPLISDLSDRLNKVRRSAREEGMGGGGAMRYTAIRVRASCIMGTG